MILAICTGSLAFWYKQCLHPPQNHMLKCNPQCDGIWRQALWKEELSQMGFVPCERDPESFLTPSAWGHKTASYEPGSRLLPDIECAGALILDFPASWTVRNFCLWDTQFTVFCYSSRKGARQLQSVLTLKVGPSILLCSLSYKEICSVN